MKRIICIILLLTMLVSLCSCSAVIPAMSRGKNEKMLFLVAGFDDAAENTDVLFTVGMDTSQNSIYIAQIPRDTYFSVGNSQNKINSIYAGARAMGHDEQSAMNFTMNALSEALGVEFDGYIAVGVDDFGRIVDDIGGVDIELNQDMTLDFDEDESLMLYRGVNHVDGNAAKMFVRYRKGYSTQDLGRMDAQKIFLFALLKKVSGGLTLPAIISLSSTLQKSTLTNLKMRDLVPMVWKSIRARGDMTVEFVTIPGEAAVGENGASYYVINRHACEKIVRKYMFSASPFDKNNMFLNKDNEIFIDIYEDNSIGYKEYNSGNIGDMSLKNK